MSYQMLLEQIRARPDSPIELEKPVTTAELATPALVLERAAFQRNVQRMAEHVQRYGKGFRPHAKTHKCPIICHAQMEAGAVGVCAAKVSEAVALVQAGVHDILITSPLAGAAKVAVVAELSQQCAGKLAIVVDSLIGVDLLVSAMQQTEGPQLNILIDLDVAMGRTGVREDELVLALHERIQRCERLQFKGFQHYAGHVMHIAGHAERASVSLALWEPIIERVSRLQAQGVSYELLTGCGTGTYDIDVEIPEITDLQVGSYIFMDEEYRRIGGRDSDRFTDFEVSLNIACTAISQPMGGAMTVDAGYKSMASDTVPPAVDELANTKFRFAGDEHGVLLSRESMQSVHLGDVVRLVTPHCDPTVNLHDYYWVLEEDGLIHSCWPITARGCTW